MAVKRIGSVIHLNPADIAEYERIHVQVWPTVLAALKKAHVQNYSIYRYNKTLFSYMEYFGDDFEADMAAIAADPETQRWWKITEPMQKPVDDRNPNEWWHTIPESFHMD